MEQTLTDQIIDRAWEIFLAYRDEGQDTLRFEYRDAVLSWIWAADKEEKANFNEQGQKIAKDLLRHAIDESLKTQDKVFLYTCPDNALISIDAVNPEQLEAAMGSFDLEPGYEGKLYIGWD